MMHRTSLTIETAHPEIGRVLARAMRTEDGFRLDVWRFMDPDRRGEYWDTAHAALILGPRYPGDRWLGRVGSEFRAENRTRDAVVYGILYERFPTLAREVKRVHRGGVIVVPKRREE